MKTRQLKDVKSMTLWAASILATSLRQHPLVVRWFSRKVHHVLTCLPNLVDTTTVALHLCAAPEVAAAGVCFATALKKIGPQDPDRRHYMLNVLSYVQCCSYAFLFLQLV